MANAKKCDVCGTFYDMHDRVFVNGLGYNCVALCYGGNHTYYDMCPTCMKVVLDFMLKEDINNGED